MKYEPATDWKIIHSVMQCIESGIRMPSRADVAKQLTLSRTTVSTIVGQLIESGLVMELDSSAQGRGRPGIPLTLDPKNWFALGAAFQGKTWMFLIVDINGNIVREHSKTILQTTEDSFIESLVSGLKQMRENFPGKLLPQIGIGSPGLVSSDTGTIIRADDMGWKNIPLGNIIQKRIGLPAVIMNRNRTSGLAEAKLGAGKNVSDLIFIGIGTGISAAIFTDGRLVNGTSYSAGEIGHTLVDPNGPLCGCGRYGCLQALASSSALVHLVKERHRTLKKNDDAIPPNSLWEIIDDDAKLTGEYVSIEANKGNPIARECLNDLARYLGIATANLINTLNPRKVLLGGTLSNSGPLLTQLVSAEAEKHAMAAPMAAATIEQGRLGNKAAALGATSLPLAHKVDLVIHQ
ncbi:MAG: ROK family transcriptional regulator [Treponemataceae bacterium]